MFWKSTSKKSTKKDFYTLLDLHPSIPGERARYDNDAVRDVVKHNPVLAMEEYQFRGVGSARPLAVAIGLGASLDVVELMLSACPKALKETVSGRRSVLHYACVHRTSPSVVSLLVENYPRALYERDCFGQTPLHAACKNGAELGVVQVLLEKHTSALSVSDNTDSTPLHWACKYRAPLEVVKVLIEGYPLSLQKKDRHGNTPLMLAEEELGRRSEGALPEVVSVLTALHTLMNLQPDHRHVLEIMDEFQSMRWWGGVMLILKDRPFLVQRMALDPWVTAHLLSRIGQENLDDLLLQNIYSIVKEMPDIVGSRCAQHEDAEGKVAESTTNEC